MMLELCSFGDEAHYKIIQKHLSLTHG
jgi:hypothetical protein